MWSHPLLGRDSLDIYSTVSVMSSISLVEGVDCLLWISGNENYSIKHFCAAIHPDTMDYLTLAEKIQIGL